MLERTRVHRASDSDAEVVAAISAQVGEEGFVIAMEPDRVRKMLSDANYHVVVGELDDETAGYATAVHSWAAKLHILDVAVKKERRRLGVGRTMVKYLIAHAAEKQLSEVYCEVKARNVAALNLFAGLGLRFRVYSTITQDPFYGLYLNLEAP